MVKFTSLLGIALLAVAAAATPCSKTDTRFVGQKATLTQSAKVFNNQTFTVGGTVEITDGCSFVVRNFTYSPEFPGTAWYGRRGNNGASGIRVAQEAVTGNNGTDSGTFNMVATVGAESSFNDFDTFVLFVPTSNYELAIAQFPALVSNTTSTVASTTTMVSTVRATATSVPAKTTTAAPTKTAGPSATQQAASSGEKLGLGGMAAAGLAAAAVAAIGL